MKCLRGICVYHDHPSRTRRIVVCDDPISVTLIGQEAETEHRRDRIYYRGDSGLILLCAPRRIRLPSWITEIFDSGSIKCDDFFATPIGTPRDIDESLDLYWIEWYGDRLTLPETIRPYICPMDTIATDLIKCTDDPFISHWIGSRDDTLAIDTGSSITIYLKRIDRDEIFLGDGFRIGREIILDRDRSDEIGRRRE